MMKVLMVNKFLHRNGGSETYILEIGRQLERMGHEVQYFGMEHPNRIVGNRIDCYTDNVDFHGKNRDKFIYPFKIIYSCEAKKKMERVLEDFQPDVVHLNNFNFQLTPSVIYGIKAYERRYAKKVKVIFTAHDYQLICPNHMMRIPAVDENCRQCLNGNVFRCVKNKCIHDSYARSFLGAVEGWLYGKLKTYRYLDRIICPSCFMQEMFRSRPLFSSKTVVMHNFVDMPEIEAGGTSGYVLYFGRFSREKGIGTLLNVCRALPGIPFVFAGGGPLTDEVCSLKNILYKGFLGQQELRQVIAGAAFSVYPSEWYENCPFSVMESIACGTPVLGADIGGIPELIEQGETGELFISGNEEDLKRKILRLWNEKEMLSVYKRRCKEKHFATVEEYCKRLLSLYQGEEVG